jgi:hypothetical protein
LENSGGDGLEQMVVALSVLLKIIFLHFLVVTWCTSRLLLLNIISIFPVHVIYNALPFDE